MNPAWASQDLVDEIELLKSIFDADFVVEIFQTGFGSFFYRSEIYNFGLFL